MFSYILFDLDGTISDPKFENELYPGMAELLRDLKAGDPVTVEDVDLSGLDIYKLYLEGLKL